MGKIHRGLRIGRQGKGTGLDRRQKRYGGERGQREGKGWGPRTERTGRHRTDRETSKIPRIGDKIQRTEEMGAEDGIEKQGQELTETREQGLGNMGLRDD